MIAVDDLRPFLGCYGEQRARTPNIDRLASLSVQFNRVYCQYAKCGPSRLSVLSGLRPDSVGVISHKKGADKEFRRKRPDVSMMPKWFKQHGYETLGFGKIQHDGFDEPADWSTAPFTGREKEIWEVFQREGPSVIAHRLSCPAIQKPDVPDSYFFAGRLTSEAIKEIKKDRQKPLFLAVGYRRPHLPFVAPKKYFDMHKPNKSWLKYFDAPVNAPVLAFFNSDGYAGAARKFNLKMPPSPTRKEALDLNGFELRSYRGVPVKGPFSDAEKLELLHAYASCVSYVDAQIGKLLKALEDEGRLKSTVIILWSDHGWHLGEQGAWAKMTNYEIGTRVPLLISAPGLEPAITESLTELVDLYPTLCDLTRIEKPKFLEGKSLIEVLKAPEKHHRKYVLSQFNRYGSRYTGRALRTDRFRYVVWTDLKNNVVARELYDHQNDPGETKNLAADSTYENAVLQLEKLLKSAFKKL